MDTIPSLSYRIRKLARLPVLLVVLIIWIPLTIFSLLMLALPRRGAARSDSRNLTVLAPFEPGNKSGGAQAIAGLMASLEGRFHTHLIDLSAQENPSDIFARLAYVLTFPIPVPDHCRRLLIRPGNVSRGLDDIQRLLIEFPGPALFLTMGRRPGYRIILRDHEVLLRKLLMEMHAAKRLQAPQHALGIAVCYLLCLAVYARVDRIIALTDEDARCLGRWYPFLRRRICSIPVHFQCTDPPPSADHSLEARELMFVGNFFHQPNVDGLLWFLRNVAPGLDPGFRLHLCGIDAPLDHVPIDDTHVQIVRHGFVEDISEQFARVGIALAPIVSGGGVRVKNLHLACLEKAIVSTSLGNQGIGFTDGIEAVIADDGMEMAQRLNNLAASPHRIREMGTAARAFVLRAFDKEAVANKLAEQIER